MSQRAVLRLSKPASSTMTSHPVEQPSNLNLLIRNFPPLSPIGPNLNICNLRHCESSKSHLLQKHCILTLPTPSFLPLHTTPPPSFLLPHHILQPPSLSYPSNTPHITPHPFSTTYHHSSCVTISTQAPLPLQSGEYCQGLDIVDVEGVGVGLLHPSHSFLPHPRIIYFFTSSAYLSSFTHIYTHEWIQIYTHAWMNTNIHTHEWTQIYTRMNEHKYTHAWMNTNIHTHG